MKTTFAIAALGALAVFAADVAPTSAQVVPSELTNTSADGTFLGPLSSSTRRYQMIIDEGELTPFLNQTIDGLSFRLNETATSAFPAADTTYADYDIFMGGGVDPSNRSLTFADNRVGTQTQVRDGALTIPAGSYAAGGNPNAFGPTIDFDTGYFYTGGDLIVELVHSTSDGSSASTDAVLASGGPANGYDVRFGATWSGSLSADAGSRGNFTVLQFSTGVPEPASLSLLGLGGLALIRRRR